MSILTNGTTIAATDAQSYALSKMIGIPASYGRAEVLGNVPLPQALIQQAAELGEPLDGFAAYVVKPVNGDGSDLTADDWGGDDDPTDVAFLVVVNPNDQLAQSPIGPLTTAVIAEKVSRSLFLAHAEVREAAMVDQFTAALGDDDALAEMIAQFEAECDDDDTADDGFTD